MRNNFFPLSSKYDLNWIKSNSLGENVLYNLESLCEILKLNKGMKVLDLGCGKAISAIFLAREYDVEVWAVDSEISPTENYKRIKDMNCESKVFPLELNAHKLPFPENFFDVIIAVDSFMYFGADEKFPPYISSFLKSNGQLGIVDICFTKEINFIAELPGYLKKDYHTKWYFVHSLDWWRRIWEKSGILSVNSCEYVPEDNFIKSEYMKYNTDKKKKDFISEALSEDKENLIRFFRMSAVKAEKNSEG